jgi:hypothetical protein
MDHYDIRIETGNLHEVLRKQNRRRKDNFLSELADVGDIEIYKIIVKLQNNPHLKRRDAAPARSHHPQSPKPRLVPRRPVRPVHPQQIVVYRD